MLKLKLKAGALQVTLFIVVVIALLLAAFLILVHTHKQFSLQTDFLIQTVENSNNGINYALNNPTKLNDIVNISLKEEDYKSLKVHRDFWGVFEKVTTTSKIKNKRFQKTALIGALQQDTNRTTLYVEDNNKPLVLVGNTQIRGLAHLPKRGVKSGNISGQSYYGSQLIFGQTKQSVNLPKLFSETQKQIKTISNQFTTQNKTFKYLNIESGNTYKNSFLKPLQVVLSSGTINLTNIELVGHIVVQSKTKIVVDRSSKLKDVVLIAPKIEIKDQVKGVFQAIATKEIKVGRNCQLNYPSALVLNENKTVLQVDTQTQIQQKNNIVIDKNTVLKGLVIYIGNSNPNNYKVQIAIEETATVLGEVYCNGNIELKGSVYGSVFTSNFIANLFGSVYQNHIYNGTINIEELPTEYVGLTFNNSNKSVAKWLY